jgi:AcrR family transcriptional regulator
MDTRCVTPGTDSARRTQAERRADAEDSLLRAAAALVAERGIEGATFARIGERAGSSRALPTYHFGSKDALVARLAQYAQDRISAAAGAILERAERSVEELNALETTRLMVAADLKLFGGDPAPEDRALLVLWGTTFPSEAAVEGMLDADRRSYDGWADLIRLGQADGSVRADLEPEAAAVVLLGVTRGVAASLLSSTLDEATKRQARSACDVFIESALAARKTDVHQ